MLTLEDCRRFYADEVRFSANLTSAALIEAFAHVPREKFLGPPPWKIGSAVSQALSATGLGKAIYIATEDPRDVYHNVVVALDPGKDLNNGQPGSLALWIDALDLKAGERVYHLGCGVGYYTAIMAEVVGSNGAVTGSEVHEELAGCARANLSLYPNVMVHAGDGAAFDPGECDAMLINAGVTHPHRPWLERLREGGRVVLPITMSSGAGQGQGLMIRIVRERGGFSAGIVSPVAIFTCTSVRDAQVEGQIPKAFASRAFFKLKSIRLDAHGPAETCILHGSNVCVSSAELNASSAAAAG